MIRHARIIWYLFRLTNIFLSDVICAETFDNSGLNFDSFFFRSELFVCKRSCSFKTFCKAENTMHSGEQRSDKKVSMCFI